MTMGDGCRPGRSATCSTRRFAAAPTPLPSVPPRSAGPTPNWTPLPANPTDRPYAMSTSGSTARPKAVAVPHAALLNDVLAAIDYLGLAPERDAVLWTSRPTSDGSVEECLPALCTGATVGLTEH